MAGMVTKDHPEALALAQMFSTCVECFGLIHPGKEDHQQKVAVAQLGIQQARLLAWGDMVGILDVTASRDQRLEETEMRKTIEQALQEIIDRPNHTDRETQFEQFGLKPPKRFSKYSEPALDAVRIESFRTRLERFQRQRWELKRGMSMTVNHWMIVDLPKFHGYLALIKEKVEFLVGVMGIEQQVIAAIRHDIRALGWHPVFERTRAMTDMLKLRLIKEATETEYPPYAEAAQQGLDNLDKEWADNYRDTLLGNPTSTEIPGAAAYIMSQSRSVQSAYGKKSSSGGSGLFGLLRPKSWKKGAKESSASASEDEDRGRSQSYAQPATQPLSPPMSPEKERSKSLAHHTESLNAEPEVVTPPESEEDPLSRVMTARSVDLGTTAGPVKSAISRHDYWRPPW
jgi:hypothetical protein